MLTKQTEGKYRIGSAARMTGISTHALRVWERRYNAVEPSRTPGGDRLYSDADIDRLRAIKRLIELGHPVGRIAPLADEPLFELLAEHDQPPPEAPNIEIRRQFIASLVELDVREAEQILTRAAMLTPSREFLFEVVAPLLTDIGEAWARGDVRIAHEHAASALLRNLVGTVMRIEPRLPDAPTVVATTLSGELHEFGALMAALMAAAYRWNPVYLGPNLPADEIIHAVDQSGAEALMLSFVNDELTEATRDELSRLLDELPPAVSVVAGGRAVKGVRDLLAARVDSTTVLSLEELEQWIDTYDRARIAESS
jgi:DNA-binding transcriptional MerR regulator